MRKDKNGKHVLTKVLVLQPLRCENQVGFGVLNAVASKGTAAGLFVSVARL
jgi:hypothetical protein